MGWRVAIRDFLYSLVGSVGRRRLEGLPVVWGTIFLTYWWVSMTTAARPLSAGKIVMSGILRRCLRALVSS